MLLTAPFTCCDLDAEADHHDPCGSPKSFPFVIERDKAVSFCSSASLSDFIKRKYGVRPSPCTSQTSRDTSLCKLHVSESVRNFLEPEKNDKCSDGFIAKQIVKLSVFNWKNIAPVTSSYSYLIVL